MTEAPGAARVTFVGHSTVLLEGDGVRVLTDPLLRERIGPLRRHGHRIGPDELGPIDLVVVSHAHLDHLDPASLRRLQGTPTILVPRGVGPKLRALGFERVEEVVAGDRLTVHGLAVSVVRARHGTVLTPLIPRSRPVGYVLEGGVRTYFAGDTGIFPEMSELAYRVDLALLPVWVWGPVMGPGHLDPRRAAHAAELIRPPVAIPIHWATYYPAGLDRLSRQHLLEPGPTFARHLARWAPSTEARVLKPGESTVVGRPGRGDPVAGAARPEPVGPARDFSPAGSGGGRVKTVPSSGAASAQIRPPIASRRQTYSPIVRSGQRRDS